MKPPTDYIRHAARVARKIQGRSGFAWLPVTSPEVIGAGSELVRTRE